MEKTNVMRLLDRNRINYTPHFYSGVLSGTDIAACLGEDPAKVFKTLVTVSASRKNYVFMIPVMEELDLKKAAAAVGEKSISMLPQKELLPLTGYIHGGCSPIGMKKQFRTMIHMTAMSFGTIFFSAGKVGAQVEMAPGDISGLCPVDPADLIV